MALTILFSVLANLVFIQGRTEVGELGLRPDNLTHFDVYASALSKAHYNPWYCSYKTEPGYKCLSCKSALHCYPGNFALLVQCAGLFPFCRNGYCSRYKTDGCVEDAPAETNAHYTVKPSEYIKGNKTTTVTTNPLIPTEMYESIMDESASNKITTTTEFNEVLTSSAAAEDTTKIRIVDKIRDRLGFNDKIND